MATSSSKSSSKSVALGKRAKIDSAQRNMLIFVGIASVLIGITVVAVIYFAKTISFNNKLIAAKADIIKVYSKTQDNLTSISNKISGLSTNEYLESVARMRDKACTNEEQEKGVDDKYTLEQLENVRRCSALRVITDALPYTKNQDSALTSFYILNVLSQGGASIDSIKATDFEPTSFEGISLSAMKISADLKDTPNNILSSISSIEKSIRNFNIDKATLSFGLNEEVGTMLTMSAAYYSYSADKAGLTYQKKIVCANKDNEKCKKAGGDGRVLEVQNQ